MGEEPPERQLARFMACYEPEVEGLARDVLARMRSLLPGAFELVYDNYNALAIVFGPTERASDAIFSIALYPRWVNLFFLQGAALPDPHGLLQGSGKLVRSIRLTDAVDLDRPEVRELIATAVDLGPGPFDPSNPGKMIIKSISPNRRPRRPAQP